MMQMLILRKTFNVVSGKVGIGTDSPAEQKKTEISIGATGTGNA